MANKIRVDKWLWAVRVYKTRAKANDACDAGRIRVNGEVAKPATKVGVGDRVEVRRRDRTMLVEVVEPLAKRVSAQLAAAAYVDHSPPAPERSTRSDDHVATDDLVVTGERRERGAGRPTKRDRRRIAQLKGRA